MPAFGTNALRTFVANVAIVVIATIDLIHCNFPGVQATVPGAVRSKLFFRQNSFTDFIKGTVTIAAAPCIPTQAGHIARIVIQVLGHPYLISDFNRLIDLSIAFIGKLSIVDARIQVIPSAFHFFARRRHLLARRAA